MVIKMEDEDYMRFLNNQYAHENEIIDTMTKPLSQNTEDIDPAYKTFLEHLREDGKSYVFEMINGDNDPPTLIKYEGEDDLSENNEAATKTSSGNILLEGRNDSATKKGQKRRRLWPKSGEGVNKPSESSMVDESYQTFLSHLKWEGGSMVLEFGSLSITYDGERESTISSDILAPESNVKSDELSLVPYKSPEPDITVCEDGNMASLQQCELYKTELMAILDKPYDQDEYEELLEEAKERKPLSKQKHLRSMSISYETKEVGQSYLDHFPGTWCVGKVDLSLMILGSIEVTYRGWIQIFLSSVAVVLIYTRQGRVLSHMERMMRTSRYVHVIFVVFISAGDVAFQHCGFHFLVSSYFSSSYFNCNS
ncbi:uncharacterized protein LOC109838067 isoform X2 [Asparagus officinalis]|uniref:uncharacterized protein LOC109838067 isoform X2 n=1 Tax=Asparagus officinalis TaxID=4686 RepID=UPI00098E3610|nr:uncharacterized protein LOC109838067 isoform X2 [Asparagus officinalis]